MKRRRTARSHGKLASRSDTRIPRSVRIWGLCGGFLAIVALAGAVLLVQHHFGGGGVGPRVNDSTEMGLPPYLAGDPEFRPVKASADQLIEKALLAARTVADCFPNDPASIDLLARLQGRFGTSTEAIASWKRCLELDPTHVSAYYGIGSAAADKQQYDEAAQCFRKVLELDPDSPQAPVDLAHALTNLGKLEEVVTILEDWTSEHRGSMPPFLILAQAYQQLKQYEKAKRNFEIAVQLAPDYPSAHYGLASACARLGEKNQARTHREIFSKLESEQLEDMTRVDGESDDDISVHRSLGQSYTDAGRLYLHHGMASEAERLWRTAAAIDAEDVACRQELAALYERAERAEEALLICEELLEIEPENPDYCLNVGLLNARLNRFAAARLAVQRAIELAPEDPHYRKVYEMIEEGE